ncbi:nucleotide pyrophosphohydrolase [Candidatus Peregrinibacteria bacterium]|nr:nucleotide pyrophosphohydrolase [Candidatus Peregrinibacteria bacterium]
MPKKRTLKDLKQIAEKLRSDTGCPWDRDQTILSMLKYIKDEVDEVAQAIENADHANLREELGDVLFQIVMISQIAKEHGYFNLDNVVSDIYDKIKSRHTWVFGKDKAKTPEEAMAMWKKNKAKEKK